MSALDDAASLDLLAHGELQHMKEELARLRAELEALRKLADDLYLIMPGQPGHGDISREQRTKADYMKLRGEEEK